MVGVDLMAQMTSQESFYEEVIVKERDSPPNTRNHNIMIVEKNDITARATERTLPCPTNEEVEEFENIYEVIPGDRLVYGCDKSAVNRSSSFCCTEKDRRNSREEKESQTDRAYSSNSAPSSPRPEDAYDQSYSPYAEIIHNNSSSDFIPSRPTRDSENPILRQDFSGNLAFMPKLRNLRKKITAISQDRCLERSSKTTPSSTPERERKLEKTQEIGSRGISPKQSPNQSPRAKSTQGPIYVNMEFPLVDGDINSRRSSASSCSYGERQSVSSNEDAVFRDTEVSPYENVKNMGFHESGISKETSAPVDILYSDLEFHPSHRTAKSKLDKSLSNPAGSIRRVEEKSRSLPPTQPSPRLPPRGNNLTESMRPKSKSLGKLSGGALGFYVARFVKKATVQRSNSKTLQATMHDIVSKTKVEECSSVNVEVTSDMMRISTNCPPWEVIASFGIEDIGCIELYEQDRTTLGVIVCAPGEDAECYVFRCPDALLIYGVIRNAFNSPNTKAFKVPISTPVGPESWLGDDDVTTFEDILYLGSLKVKKSYLLINQSITTLLEKAHPKDFKSIYLEVQPDNIRLINANGDNAVIDQHAIPWILLLGVYEEDKRLFGYIVSEARQGGKTRMYCHVFRCSRITSSVAATEVIRLGCQASYGDRRDSVKSRRRNSSQVSLSSRGSGGSNESASSPTHAQLPNSLVEEPEEEQQHVEQEKPKDKEEKTGIGKSKLRRFKSMPQLIRASSKKAGKEHKIEHKIEHEAHDRTTSFNSTSTDDILDNTWEIVEEKDYNFNATYLCSTVINPPLRAKHVRDCVKQYQKQQTKSLKRFGVEQPSSDVVLYISLDGINMNNARTQKGGNGMFFPFSSVSHVMEHPEHPEYFAFATVVSGDSKHKCHLFRQTDVPTTQVIESFQAFM